MQHAPIILVTTSFLEPSKEGEAAKSGTSLLNTDAVSETGGIPVLVPIGVASDKLATLADLADGLFLPGGGDVHPSRFGEADSGKIHLVNIGRDELEFALVKLFLERKKPIFGICRGMQVLNVAFGGTLYQDIKSEIPAALNHTYADLSSLLRYANDAHLVRFSSNTVIGNIFGVSSLFTNSGHHQSVKKIGGGLRVSAAAEDGVIEAIESENMKEQWTVGVQWHPEGMFEKHPEQKKLFLKFLEAAGLKKDESLQNETSVR